MNYRITNADDAPVNRVPEKDYEFKERDDRHSG